MTTTNHTSEKPRTGTIRHTYRSGPFEMIVLDRQNSKTGADHHVQIRTEGHTYISVGVMPGLDLDEPDYLLETRLPSRPCDLEILIEDATLARDILAKFRRILLDDHKITTTLNGK